MRSVLTFALTVCVASICAGSAQAAEKNCASEMKRVETLMPPNQNAGKGAMARAELKLAAEKAANQDEKGCMTHVDNAEKSIR